MHISIVVAMSENRVIGINNRLPWHLPADLKHFKKITMGHPILMGRKTHESIGRPLPGRVNAVISRNIDYHPDGCIVYYSLDAALDDLKIHSKIMVIGGSTLYESCFPLAQTLYVTLIHHQIEGDTHFPHIDKTYWHENSRERFITDPNNPYDYSFIVYDRIET